MKSCVNQLSISLRKNNLQEERFVSVLVFGCLGPRSCLRDSMILDLHFPASVTGAAVNMDVQVQFYFQIFEEPPS